MGVRFTARKLPAKDAAAYVTESIRATPHRYEARDPGPRLRRGGPAVSFTWGEFEPIDDATCEYRTGDDDLHWLAMRLTMLGLDFEVTEGPPELREELREVARRVERAAGS